MAKVIIFFKKNWTLKTVLCLTIIYVISSLIFREKMTVSEIIFLLFINLYVVWGFMKEPKKKT